MGCNNAAGNIQIVPVKVLFGRYECQTITLPAGTSLGGKYISLYSGADATHYAAWFNTGASTAPTVVGATLVEVDVLVGDTAPMIAAKLAAALLADADASIDFDISVTGADMCICAMQPGVTTPASSGAGLTGVTYVENIVGSLDDVGYTDGDIEVTTDETLLDVTTHQTGKDIITSIRQGKSSKVSVVLKETDIANFKLVFGQAGTVFTPTGGTSEVVAWGTSTNSQNVIDKAGKLILHPYNNAADDFSEDFAFWKAHLQAESVTFSGENPEQIKCTFNCYTDDTRDKRADLWVYGDHTQNFKKVV